MAKRKCSFSDCQSHPGRPLTDHLVAVESAIASALDALPAEAGLPPTARLLARLAGACHDLGKATPFIQQYLASAGRGRSLYTRHAHLSALIAHSLGERLLQLRGETRISKSLGFLIFATLSIYHHHTDLEDVADDWANFIGESSDEDETVLTEQWESMDLPGVREFGERLLDRLGCPGEWRPPVARDLRFFGKTSRLRG